MRRRLVVVVLAPSAALVALGAAGPASAQPPDQPAPTIPVPPWFSTLPQLPAEVPPDLM